MVEDRSAHEPYAQNGAESDPTLEQLKMEMLTVPEVAKILQRGPNFIYERIKRGEIPHMRLGRGILVPRYALAKWIERNTIAAWQLHS